MAMVAIVVSRRSIAGATVNSGEKAQKRRTKVDGVGVEDLNSFGPPCALPTWSTHSKGTEEKLCQLSSTCNGSGEIFQISTIMNGLVLLGVVVGFLHLRVEAQVEEPI